MAEELEEKIGPLVAREGADFGIGIDTLARQLDDGEMPLICGEENRSTAGVVSRIDVGLRMVKKQTNDLKVAVFACKVKR